MAGKRTSGSEAGIADTEPGVIINAGDVIESPDADGVDAIPTVNPADLAGDPDTDSGNQKRGRGRPKGSRNTSGTKQDKETASDLGSILLGLHAMGAAFLKVEELELDEEEATKLGAAINRVNKLYGEIVLSPEQRAWLGLVMCCGTIYGPRFMAYRMRQKKEAAKQPVTIDATPPRVM